MNQMITYFKTKWSEHVHMGSRDVNIRKEDRSPSHLQLFYVPWYCGEKESGQERQTEGEKERENGRGGGERREMEEKEESTERRA